MGAAPVPSASLVLVITAYSTVFGATADADGVPNGMAYLFAIEWLMDRFSTITNITGDMVVSAIIEDKVTKKVKKDAARDIGQAKKNDDITLGGGTGNNVGDEELGAAGGDNEGEIWSS
jgi:Na+/H+-dicarboxylate symporter